MGRNGKFLSLVWKGNGMELEKTSGGGINMFEIVMYLGLIGMFISIMMIFIVPRNTLTNGVDIPKCAVAGLWIFMISICMAIIGAFFTSELGRLVIYALTK